MTGEAHWQTIGISPSRNAVHKKSVGVHAIRRGEFGLTQGNFQIYEPGVRQTLHGGALRRVVEKLTQRCLVAATPAASLAEVDLLIDRLKVRPLGTGVKDQGRDDKKYETDHCHRCEEQKSEHTAQSERPGIPDLAPQPEEEFADVSGNRDNERANRHYKRDE